MSRERFDHAIVQELEQELRQALAIEPSPDFARQVRARIDARSSWWNSLRRPQAGLALAAAAVCVLAVGIGWRVMRSPVDPVAPATTRVSVDVRLDAAGPVGTRVEMPVKVQAPRKIAKREAAEPEVIVPPDRASALAHLLALVRRGAVDEDSLRPVVSAAAPATLDVAPIVVPSIPLPAVDIQTGAPQGRAGRE